MSNAVDPSSTRYVRQRSLAGFGLESQHKLANAVVAVIGAGGLGSIVLPSLVGAGVGTVIIIDADTVDESNLHRQTLHGAASVGMLKVESAAEALGRLSPETTLIQHPTRFTRSNAAELLQGVDLLIDGSDNFATRFAANDAAAQLRVPLVWGSAAQFAGQVGVAWEERGIDFRDLFPVEPSADQELSCEIVGVLPSVCGVIGAVMATETIKILAGIGTPLLGRMLAYDALSGTTREIEYSRADNRPEYTGLRSEVRTNEVPHVTPTVLFSALQSAEDISILDVRNQEELEVASLPSVIHIPLTELAHRLDELDASKPFVVMCHKGGRSLKACNLLIDAGFTRVTNLSGGIDAWAVEVEPSMARYE